MGNKYLFEELKKLKKIKKREQLRKSYRTKPIPEKQLKRELSLHKGTIWSVPDISVPFNSRRKLEEIKEGLRPSLVLETPTSFSDYDEVWLAPGTSKKHKLKSDVLLAKVPPEALKTTTWFLLKYSWLSVQKNLEKKITELSLETRDRLENILRQFYNEQ